MNKIKVLSEEVSNRIAAGEVIERPVSVVKELVENSIDAASTKITVNLEKCGKKLIQVIDNGCGMSEDDALQCFERHATSKIRTVSDIFQISTLGFRGEALPSIASVSYLTLITRTDDSDVATKVEFRTGQLSNYEKASANIGTNIVVRNLFSNVPARKKFLKTDNTEYKHILNYMHYQSILHPEIHFKLISNGNERINYPAVESKEDRLSAIFGSDFLKKELIDLKITQNDLSISGFIAGLEEEQGSLFDFHYIFVNGRYVKNKIVYHSIKSAYEPFIKKLRIFQQGKLPPFIIFLEVDPQLVDFNVHPAKLEIRFVDSSRIHQFVKNSIYQSLLNYEDNKYAKIKNVLSNNLSFAPVTKIEEKIFTSRTDKKRVKDIQKKIDDVQLEIFPKKHIPEQPQNQIYKAGMNIYLRPEEDIVNPWQLHQSYIFIQVEEGLIIIDQHAAHERIIYEKLIHRIHGAPSETQKLLFPIVIDIPPYLSHLIPDLISENMLDFQKVGFSIKTFSGNSVVIDEIPAELRDWEGGDVFIEILKTLQDEFAVKEDFRDSIAKSVSCKAAIKAGEKLSKKEMLNLINDLFACDVPYFCPHGRPLIIKMPLSDFEKKFKRIM